MNQLKKMKKQNPLKLTRRELILLTTLAENEIKQWTSFFNNLQNIYGKATKGRKTNTKSR